MSRISAHPQIYDRFYPESLTLRSGEEVHLGPIELGVEDKVRVWASGTGRFYLGLLNKVEFDRDFKPKLARTKFKWGTSTEDLRRNFEHGVGPHYFVIRNPDWNPIAIGVELQIRIERPSAANVSEGTSIPAPPLPDLIELNRPTQFSPRTLEFLMAVRTSLWILGWSGLGVLLIVVDVYALSITGGSALPEVLVGNATLILAIVTYYGLRRQVLESRLARARRPPPPM